MSSRKQSVTKAIRADRRKHADLRKEEYDKLSLQEKLDKLPPAPAAKKQRARLEALLAKKEEAQKTSKDSNVEQKTKEKSK